MEEDRKSAGAFQRFRQVLYSTASTNMSNIVHIYLSRSIDGTAVWPRRMNSMPASTEIQEKKSPGKMFELFLDNGHHTSLT